MSADTRGCMAGYAYGHGGRTTPKCRNVVNSDSSTRWQLWLPDESEGSNGSDESGPGRLSTGLARPDRTSCARGPHRVLLGVGGHGDMQSRTSPHDHSPAQTPHRTMVSTLHPGEEPSLDRAAAPRQRGEPRPAQRLGAAPQVFSMSVPVPDVPGHIGDGGSGSWLCPQSGRRRTEGVRVRTADSPRPA